MSSGEFKLRVHVRRTRVVGWMLACVLALTLLSLVANVAWIERWPMSGMAIALFSADRELSLPSWWSSTVLAALGVLTWLLASRHSGATWRDKLPWWLLAAGFLFLSADEACTLHERIGGKVKLEGTFHHARWIIIWLPPALIASGFLMWRLWRSYPHLVIGLAIGIVIFITGAAGLETLNAANRDKAATAINAPAELVQDADTSFVPTEWRRERAYYPYVLGTALEELLEMLAPLVWVWVLLDKRSARGPSTTEADQPAAASPPRPDRKPSRTAPGYAR